MPRRKPNKSNVQGDGQSQGDGGTRSGEGDTPRAQHQPQGQPRQRPQPGSSGDGQQGQKGRRGNPVKDSSIREAAQGIEQISLSEQPGQGQQHQRRPPGFQAQQPRGPPGTQEHQPQQQQPQRGPPSFQGQPQFQGPPHGQQQQQQPRGPPGAQGQQQQQGSPSFQGQPQFQGPPHGQQQQRQPRGPRDAQGQQQQRGPPSFQGQPQFQGPPHGQQQQQQPRGPPGAQGQQQQQGSPSFQGQPQYQRPPQGQQQQTWGPSGAQGQQPQQQRGPPSFQGQSQFQGPPHGQQQQRQPRGPSGAQGQQPQQQQQQQRGPPQGQQQQQQPRGPSGTQGQQPQQQQRGPPQGQQQPRQSWGPPGAQGHQHQQQRPSQPQPTEPPGFQEQQQRQLSESSSDSQRQPMQQEGVSSTPPAVVQTSTDLLPIPPRKIKAGRRPGRKIIVDVNHMALNLRSYDMEAYHYDVVITPDRPKYMIPTAVNAFIRREFPSRYPAFDGRKNLFSNGPLMKGTTHSGTVAIVNPENRQQEKTFDISIHEVSKVDMATLRNYFERREAPQNALLVLDVALRASTAANMIQVGRTFFMPPRGEIIDLGNGLDMWYGLFQSATLGWKPLLNVDVVHKGFYKSMPVSDAFKYLCREDPRVLNEYIEGLKVDYGIPNDPGSRRIWRVNGVKGCPKNEVFRDNDNNVQWTVFDYYDQQKRYRIRDPTLPCLWVGSRQRNILVPAELCTIASNQPHRHKLSESQTAKMVRSAATDTHTRRRKIMEAYNTSGIKPENPYLREFGIVVSGEFEHVEARVLPPPSLEYKDRDMPVNKGVWQSGEFVNAVPIKKWGILNLDHMARQGDIKELSRNLCSSGSSVGMKIDPPNFLDEQDWRRRDRLTNWFQQHKDYQIIFVVIPNRGEVYSVVKRIAEVTAGVLTQCIRCQTLSKLNRSTVVNILLKVNAKLNGINVVFSNTARPACLNEPTMILGADVTHPGPDSNMPSIAAVVATHDPKAFQHNKIWRFQDPRQEIIQDLDQIIKEQLLFFFKRTKQKPLRLIFFRDGVSEGQIAQVMTHEVRAIRNACKKMGDGSYEPKITFVIVQKRHHTRLFPNKKDSEDRNCNVPAGTVVDTDIVHPRETEFYLVSHASIQGTARPTKYRLVYDDANMSEDELEELTYYLCHLFARCTRSVSYPTPTYYAHVAAFRQRSLIGGEKIHMGNLQQAQRDFEIQDSLKSSNPMHFI